MTETPPAPTAPSIYRLFDTIKNTVPTPETVTRVFSDVPSTPPAQMQPPAPQPRSRVIEIPARLLSALATYPMAHPLSTCSSAAALLSLGYLGLTAYRAFFAHYAYITIIETVHLPPETTESFVELSIPLKGEVRLTCALLSCCKFMMKMSGSLKPEHTGSPRSSVRSGRVASPPKQSSHSGVPLRNVVLSEICDSYLSEYTGHCYFAPACVTEGALLMTYESQSHESFQAPVSVGQCWVQSGAVPNAHRLTFNINVHGSVLDFVVTVVLPKYAHILSVNTNNKGSWHYASTNELIWYIGTFDKKDSMSPSRQRNGQPILRPGVTNDERNVTFDSIKSNGGCSTPRSQRSDEEAPVSVAVMAAEQMKALALGAATGDSVLSFEAVYVIAPSGSGELLEGSGPPGARGGLAPNRKQRRAAEREERRKNKASRHYEPSRVPVAGDKNTDSDDDTKSTTTRLHSQHTDSFDPNVNVPGVSLSYTVTTAISGLSIRRFNILSETNNYDLMHDLTSAPVAKPYVTSSGITLPPAPPNEGVLAKALRHSVHLYHVTGVWTMGTLRGVSRTVRLQLLQPLRRELCRLTNRPYTLSPEEAAEHAALQEQIGQDLNRSQTQPVVVSSHNSISHHPNEGSLYFTPDERRAIAAGDSLANTSNRLGLDSTTRSLGGVQSANATSGGNKHTGVPPATRKLSKKVRYITRFIQPVRVTANY